MTAPRPENVREWLKHAESHLVSHGVPNARRNAEWMLCHSLGWSMLDVYVQSAAPIDNESARRYWEIVERRASREPLQYILQGTEFMSLPFEVRPGVFVPRPETEVLVERAEARLRARPLHEPLAVLDLCCGTGIVGVSLAYRVPNLDVVAVDASPEAVDLTAANANRNAVTDRVRPVQADGFDFLEHFEGRFAAVLCNPPYIPTAELAALPREVRDHEPMRALDGGADGLDFYRRVAPLLARRLHANGFVMFEIGDTQAAAVSALLQSAGFAGVGVDQDLAGCDRVVWANKE
ncbi:MAG TPA: peptide chain release factor N(5)-glutamine methyltransferase [Candidatus Krumholzibacteria bacterium]|nr:peptide chain release factor N(5)-glutamine methyltransferase [Candidatus Krumholzibacteria bacterium]